MKGTGSAGGEACVRFFLPSAAGHVMTLSPERHIRPTVVSQSVPSVVRVPAARSPHFLFRPLPFHSPPSSSFLLLIFITIFAARSQKEGVVAGEGRGRVGWVAGQKVGTSPSVARWQILQRSVAEPYNLKIWL